MLTCLSTSGRALNELGGRESVMRFRMAVSGSGDAITTGSTTAGSWITSGSGTGVGSASATSSSICSSSESEKCSSASPLPFPLVCSAAGAPSVRLTFKTANNFLWYTARVVSAFWGWIDSDLISHFLQNDEVRLWSKSLPTIGPAGIPWILNCS